jgi:hypothetical protein
VFCAGGSDSDVKVLQSYSDGSIENDLPMQQLSELFNVNHFIVSQVNFHSALFSSLSMRGARQDSLFSSVLLYGIVGYVRFLKAQMKDWLKNLIKFFNHSLAGSAPTWSRGLARLFTQDYEGREFDVTIMPWVGHIGLLQAGMSVIKNPTLEEYLEVVKAAEINTYSYMPRIKAHCDTEMTLDRCVQRLRRRVAEEDLAGEATECFVEANKNKLGHKRLVNKSDRTPSFYTSRSIVNLSGLSVADPVPALSLSRVATHTPRSSNTENIVNASSVSNSVEAAVEGNRQRTSSASSTGSTSGIRKLFGSFKELQGTDEGNSAAQLHNVGELSANVGSIPVSARSRTGSLDFQMGSALSISDDERDDDSSKLSGEDDLAHQILDIRDMNMHPNTSRRNSEESGEGPGLAPANKITKYVRYTAIISFFAPVPMLFTF